MNATSAEQRKHNPTSGDTGFGTASGCVGIELLAAVISIADDEPVVAILASRDGSQSDRLPSAIYALGTRQGLDDTLRLPLEHQTGYALGHLQQLLAFSGGASSTEVMVGYLGLVSDRSAFRRPSAKTRLRSAACRWLGCYLYLPWEDWRSGRPTLIDGVIIPRLAAWASAVPHAHVATTSALLRTQAERTARVRLAFGTGGSSWDDERVLTRFELLAEAGLVPEEPPVLGAALSPLDQAIGRPLAAGHRRILAAALARLRTDLKTRPVLFELMPEEFSLYDLQRAVEIILGPSLHKQNFRRLVESAGLVEPTGGMKSHTGGRPAKLYRFCRDVLLQRPGPGMRLGNC